MHETRDDLRDLQVLIDRSYAAAGEHLLRIHSPERRMTAAQVADRLTGMVLLTLATVASDGRPVGGPVDGVFYRGAFHFSSAPDSMRFRHIRRDPRVTATHLPGEELAVSVHGRAEVVDVHDAANAELRQTLIDIYLPRYGDAWLPLLEGGTYARIDAARLFAFLMREGDPGLS